MILKNIACVVTSCLLTLSGQAVGKTEVPLYKNKSPSTEKRVDDPMGQMTPCEKVLQLQNRGAGRLDEIGRIFSGESYGRVHEMGMTAAECAAMCKELQQYMLTKIKFGIPTTTSIEGIQGILQNNCTLLPHALAQGSTFNPALTQRTTEVAGKEAKVIGIHQILSPVLDIVRKLRWGRVGETFGEDLYLISEMGIVSTNGYQKNRITCMPKHSVVHGIPSGGLNRTQVSGGERELRSLYPYPFRRVIKETNPLALMTYYSAYGGVAITGSPYYMTDILRGELGFKGYVYSDWGSVDHLKTFHATTLETDEVGRLALEAGVDLNIDSAYNNFEWMVQEGRLGIRYIDLAVRRILTVKFQLGLLDTPYGDPKVVSKVVRSVEKMALAKEIADESAILLENKNQILPLDLAKYKSIAVVGPNSNQTTCGDYARTTRDTKEGVTLLQGSEEVLGNKVTVRHAEGCDWWSSKKDKIAEVVEAVCDSDLVIVVVGTRSTYLGRSPKHSTAGEGFDLSSLELPGVQEELLQEIKKTGKPMVVVLIAGKPSATPWVEENADVLLAQRYGGEQQGRSLADILVGKINPSGRLNVFLPCSIGNTPCFYNHFTADRNKPFDQPGSPEEPKGHYTFDALDPLRSFGSGQSYITSEYVDHALSDSVLIDKDQLAVTVKVKNTGKMDGKEVVRLYVRDRLSFVIIPIRQLKTFRKDLIKAGATNILILRLPISELALWNARMQEVVEPRELEIQIGNVADNIHFTKVVIVKGK